MYRKNTTGHAMTLLGYYHMDEAGDPDPDGFYPDRTEDVVGVFVDAGGNQHTYHVRSKASWVDRTTGDCDSRTWWLDHRVVDVAELCDALSSIPKPYGFHCRIGRKPSFVR